MGRADRYDERLLALSLDVTMLLVDEQGTIAPPSASNRDRGLLEGLPELALDGGGEMSRGGGLVLGETLGRGGMGIVRAAYDRALGRHVAVKTIAGLDRQVGEVPSTDVRNAPTELVHEARVTGGLAHPNVVPVYALGRDGDGSPVMVMKRIEGHLWSDELGDEKWPLAPQRLAHHLDILLLVSRAVSFAHSRGVVHRDLKPSNVMVGSFGEIYVLDWGIAVSVTEDARTLAPPASEVKHIAGTPAYMAPEMAVADGASIDRRTDVYLLGAVLHEILAGHAPHEAETIRESLVSAYASEPPALEGAPPELEEICQKALAADPHERFQSTEALRTAVAGFMTHRGSRDVEREARARVSELERLLDPVLERATAPSARAHADIHRLAIEARFGLRQALRAWPDNHDAAEALEQLLTRLVRYHLVREAHEEAAAALDELAAPSADLTGEVAALAASRLREKARILSLEKLSRGVDPKRRSAARVRFALVLAGVTAALSAAMFLVDAIHLTYGVLLAGLGVMLAASSVAWWYFRKTADESILTVRFAGGVVAVVVTLVVHTVIASLTAMPVSQGFPLMMLLTAGGLTVGAATLDRGFALSAFVYLAAYVAMRLDPAHHPLLFGVGQVLGFGSMAYVWHRAARAARPPASRR